MSLLNIYLGACWLLLRSFLFHLFLLLLHLFQKIALRFLCFSGCPRRFLLVGDGTIVFYHGAKLLLESRLKGNFAISLCQEFRAT